MKANVYCWHDKIDNVYMTGTFVFSRSERNACRGYIREFNNDKMLNPKEYELVCVGTFEDETGEFLPVVPPRVVDVKQVYAPEPKREVGEEVVDQ